MRRQWLIFLLWIGISGTRHNKRFHKNQPNKNYHLDWSRYRKKQDHRTQELIKDLDTNGSGR